MSNEQEELAHAPIGRLLIRYSTPAIVAMGVHSLYNLVDTIFVGWGVGRDALGAMAVCFPIQMFILATAQVVGIGSASMISRSLGAGQMERAERTAGASFAVVILLSLMLTAGGLVFLDPILRLFGARDGILDQGAAYLSIILSGSVFFAMAVSCHNLVRAEGNARIAMNSMVMGALINTTLDPLFIFGFGWGIRGAAIATVISHICSCIYLLVFFFQRRGLVRIRKAYLWPDMRLLPEMFSIGASSFTRVIAGSVMAIVVNNSIGYYGDNLHLAILGVVQRILIFMTLPMFGLVQGLQPIAGFNYGAHNTHRVRRAVLLAVLASTAWSTFCFTVLISMPQFLLGLFTPDEAMLEEGPTILRTMILCLPLIGFQVIGASLFQALGKAIPALFLSMSRQVLLFTPLVLILPLFMGQRGIWTAFPAADFLATLITAVWVVCEFRNLRRMD